MRVSTKRSRSQAEAAFAGTRRWPAPIPLESTTGVQSYTPSISMDAAGNATAIWSEATKIYSNSYALGSGWASAVLVDSDGTKKDDFPKLDLDADGTGIAIWRVLGGSPGPFNTRFNLLEPTQGWGTAQTIGPSEAMSCLPNVRFASPGEAFGVWCNHPAVHDDVWVNRYVVGTGWETPQLLASVDYASLSIATNVSGTAMIVLAPVDGASSAYRSPGGSWASPTPIGTSSTYYSQDVRVALDRWGYAIAVWREWITGSDAHLWANRFHPVNGWGTPVPLESSDGFVGEADIVIDRFGNATVAWQQFDGTKYDIYWTRFE